MNLPIRRGFPAAVSEFIRTHYHWILGALSFGPLLAFWPQFSSLIWFGDEWDQLDQILDQGFFGWVSRPFGENVAPLAKLSWGGLLLATRGDYSLMLVAVWTLHAFNVGLLGAWMRACGFGALSVTLTLLVLGLSSTNIESLGWSIVVILIQATTFLLAAGLYVERKLEGRVVPGAAAAGIAALFALAAALTSVRGVAVGASIFAGVSYVVIRQWKTIRPPWKPWLVFSSITLGVSIATALLVLLAASGNHQGGITVEGKLAKSAEFAAYYWTLNPFHRLIDITSYGYRTAILLGILKLCVIAFALRHATPAQGRMLVVFLTFELASAALLGLGRYHTGIGSSTSSRYQYMSIVCTAPFAALIVSTLVARVRLAPLRGIAAVALAVCVAYSVTRRWPAEIAGWSNWRGKHHLRELLTEAAPPSDRGMPGLPTMPLDRAREIARRFHIDEHLE